MRQSERGEDQQEEDNAGRSGATGSAGAGADPKAQTRNRLYERPQCVGADHREKNHCDDTADIPDDDSRGEDGEYGPDYAKPVVPSPVHILSP